MSIFKSTYHKNFKTKKWNQLKKKGSTLEKEEISSLQLQRLKIGEVESSEIKAFDQIPLSCNTKKGLKENNFIIPNKVQAQSLIYSLQGLDVVVAAKTGSGKTLAFLIPVLEILYSQSWSCDDGLGALIITPTRELAYQIFDVLRKIGKHHGFSAGLVIGGKDLKFEWSRLNKCNIVICTPGRLHHHMTQNSEFTYDNVQLLVLDEADQCLSMGFADTMNLILNQLPTERQTLLFSATQTRDVKDLIRAGCNNPVFCSVHEFSQSVMPTTLKQSYVICEEHEKIQFLFSFLKHHKQNKILIFLATCKQVKFAMSLFKHIKTGLRVLGLHGGMHQLCRLRNYDEFCKDKPSVLFATDVAARGLDINLVDWVIQLDCPEDVTTYIHRAGRTARHGKSGEALLVLSTSQEESMLLNLKSKMIYPEKIEVDNRMILCMQPKIEAAFIKFNELNEQAARAFKAYLKNIYIMKDKKVFDLKSIDLDAYARSLGLKAIPRVRFIERRQKNMPKSSTDIASDNVKIEAPRKTVDLGADGDDDIGEDFLDSSKNRTKVLMPAVMLEERIDATTEPQVDVSRRKIKIITKYAVAKKSLKKGAQLNMIVKFDDEGEAVLDPRKDMVHNAQVAMKEGRLDLEKLEAILREEDKIDKRIHADKIKEKKRIQKEKEKADKLAWIEEKIRKKKNAEPIEEPDSSESEIEDVDTQNLIDELPDPDDLYKNRLNNAEEDEEQSCSDESVDEEISSSKRKGKHVFSGKIEAKRQAKQAKKIKLAGSNDLQAIPLSEREDLALFLLRRGR